MALDLVPQDKQFVVEKEGEDMLRDYLSKVTSHPHNCDLRAVGGDHQVYGFINIILRHQCGVHTLECILHPTW